VGKLYVQSKARTPIDEVRLELDEAEHETSTVGGGTSQPVNLLHLFDSIEERLSDLEARDADVRIERMRFEGLQGQLRHKGRAFVRAARGDIAEARAKINPASSRWWWFIDDILRQERRRTWLRRVITAVAVVCFLAAAWFAYDKLFAPPPEIREAYRYIEAGRLAVDEGNSEGALTKFDSASELTPNDPEPWLWSAALRIKLGQSSEAERLFQKAEALYPTRFDFVLNRGRVFLESGQMERAQADVDAAIALEPDSGWGYYLRAGVAVRRGDYETALDDLDRAIDLADENGDTRLHTMASTQRAQLAQMQPAAAPE